MNFKPYFTKKGNNVATIDGYDSVAKYMATNLITFKEDSDILEVIHILDKKKISGAPIVNQNGEVIGMIDDKDLMKVLIDAAYHNLPVNKGKVADYMSTVFKTIPRSQDIIQVATEFTNSHYKRLCVVDDQNKLIGQISRSDVIKAIRKLT